MMDLSRWRHLSNSDSSVMFKSLCGLHEPTSAMDGVLITSMAVPQFGALEKSK